VPIGRWHRTCEHDTVALNVSIVTPWELVHVISTIYGNKVVCVCVMSDEKSAWSFSEGKNPMQRGKHQTYSYRYFTCEYSSYAVCLMTIKTLWKCNLVDPCKYVVDAVLVVAVAVAVEDSLSLSRKTTDVVEYHRWFSRTHPLDGVDSGRRSW
jgi:hypothetical protein